MRTQPIFLRDTIQLITVVQTKVPGHVDPFVGQGTPQHGSWLLSELAKEKARKPASWKSRSSSNLVSEVISHHLYCVKIESQVQPTLKGRQSHKDVNTKRWDYWGPSCRLPITPTRQQGCWFICQIPFLLVESYS